MVLKMFDFNKICRVCLELNKQSYDIFTSYYSKMNILYSHMLYKCTEIKPHKGDGLPSNICKECSKQLKRAYAFNILCVESDKKLISIVENKTVSESEVKVENSEVVLEDKKRDIEDSSDVKSIHDDDNENSKSHIKIEPKFEDDDDWNADDDDILQLEEIKTRKLDIEESIVSTTDQELAYEVKKKRGRKKEEPKYEDDDGWSADDDNLVLKEIKTRKLDMEESIVSTTDQELAYEVKKKRGRKKKVVEESEMGACTSKLPHQCDICGKFLSTKSNLKAHKICHTDQRPYKCTLCTSSFRGYSALFQHRKVHTHETPYHCHFCPKRFSRRTGLMNHLRIHTGEKLYSCSICLKDFAQSAQLSIHMKRHKGEKSFLCQDCGKGFPIKADLKVHQRIHNGEKPYSCHLCTKTFATSGNLSIHVRIHNKDLRYHCKECQRGFVTCSAYNVHIKRHKGQRDYHCECGKSFYTSSGLSQHRVVHTGEKKYQCKICQRKFSQTSHLNRHFKKEHVKPNMPVPTSDQYRVVLPRSESTKEQFNLMESAPKMLSNSESVKCEGT